MAELADALDSGSNDRKVVEVQVLLPAPPKSLENVMFSRLFVIYSKIIYFPFLYRISDMRVSLRMPSYGYTVPHRKV